MFLVLTEGEEIPWWWSMALLRPGSGSISVLPYDGALKASTLNSCVAWSLYIAHPHLCSSSLSLPLCFTLSLFLPHISPTFYFCTFGIAPFSLTPLTHKSELQQWDPAYIFRAPFVFFSLFLPQIRKIKRYPGTDLAGYNSLAFSLLFPSLPCFLWSS